MREGANYAVCGSAHLKSTRLPKEIITLLRGCGRKDPCSLERRRRAAQGGDGTSVSASSTSAIAGAQVQAALTSPLSMVPSRQNASVVLPLAVQDGALPLAAEVGDADGPHDLGDAQDAERELPEAVAHHEAGACRDAQQLRCRRVHNAPAKWTRIRGEQASSCHRDHGGVERYATPWAYTV